MLFTSGGKNPQHNDATTFISHEHDARGMELTPKLRREAKEAIVRFIRATLEAADKKGVVLGLSGGVDSAVCASLGVEALGAKNVHALILPYGKADDEEVKDALRVARSIKIDYEILDIRPACDAIPRTAKKDDKSIAGNVRARVRMIMLYRRANSDDILVMGTGNKSELLTGYFTKFGDGGADLLPIGDLYKTEVRELASILRVPKDIIAKVPTAGLWPGQTDEGELGMSYEKLDKVLMGIEYLLPDDEVARLTSVPLKEVARIKALVERGAHKRRMALVPKLGYRTVGIDWRE